MVCVARGTNLPPTTQTFVNFFQLCGAIFSLAYEILLLNLASFLWCLTGPYQKLKKQNKTKKEQTKTKNKKKLWRGLLLLPCTLGGLGVIEADVIVNLVVVETNGDVVRGDIIVESSVLVLIGVTKRKFK